jgi:hypothetical protein
MIIMTTMLALLTIITCIGIKLLLERSRHAVR